jgi:hypothetical protein
VKPRLLRVPIAAWIGLILFGCGPPAAGNGISSGPTDRDQIEIACEMALLQLERLIEERSRLGGVSVAMLAEAREVLRLGKELYLEREYELALEMVDEAIGMLKEREN